MGNSRARTAALPEKTSLATLGVADRRVALDIIAAGLDGMLWDNDDDEDRKRLERVAAWLRAQAELK